MLDKRTKLAALIALAIGNSCAFANPSGPQVVQGTATFSQPNANTLNVTNSHNAIINWQKFSIGVGQTTNFIQPSSNSAVLNRVISNNPSQILGNLNSNGRVFLVNQHGLMIGAGAQINTAGFYGSTLNITNEDFLNGNLRFDGGGFGGIQNHGYIHAGPGGNVVLVAPDIENGGVIEVDDGNVILAAGESIRITSLNDAAIEFDVQAPDNSIVNLGRIIAKQGAARLFAGNLKHSGAINATGIRRNADGSISLVAQRDIEVAAGASLDADGVDGGEISVQSLEGDVVFAGDASARGEDGAGGRIEITGQRVGLFGDASVDASGRSGGGEVLVGGDFQGGGEVQAARHTQVGPHAVVRADANDSGDGGKVIVWAEGSTIFSGAASATGGAHSGDGGFIEVSGKEWLNYSGSVDASAANGDGGSVLFDPRNLTVEIAGGVTAPLELADNLYDFIEPDSAVDSIIAPVAITSITDQGFAVELNANNNITINDPILTNEGGAGGDLTLRAGNSIFINADILTDNGKLTLIANEFAGQGVVDADRGAGAAEIRMADGVTIDTRDRVSPAFAGNLEVVMQLGNDKTNAATGDITLATVIANDVLIRHNGQNAGNSILSTASGSITANSVFIDHDDLGGGAGGNRSIGTLGLPLNLVSDFIAAHIHGSSTSGIYIDAVPTPAGPGNVTVGGTCYGDGDGGVNCGFGHVVKGLDTDFGDLVLNANSSELIVIEPIDIQGQADITALGNISMDPDARGNPLVVRAGTLNLTSLAGNILVNGGVGLSSTLESVGNNLNINAVDLVLTEGSGDGDALVIVDNGNGTLFLNGAPCATCNPLAFDPRGNGSPESGVFAANFLVAGNWTGGGDGISWTDAANWSLNMLPDNTIDVLLPAVNITIDGVAAANSLTLNGNLAIIAGGTLTIEDSTTDLLVNAGGSLTINGGTLVNLGAATFNGGFALAAGNAAFTGAPAFNGAFDVSGGTLNLVGGGRLQNANNNWRGGSITGAAPLVLGLSPDDGSTLVLSGAADKTLDTITLDMNQNDIFQSGAGNLVLANNAVVDNTLGTTYTHLGGNGGIVGVGQFNNTDGTYTHLGGSSPISVDFVNSINSIVNVAAGSLLLQDGDAGDLATYNIAGGGTLRVDADRTFGDGSTGGTINSSGTLRVSNGTATMQLLTGEFITRNLVLDPTGALAGDPVTVLSNFFWGGGGLPGQLTTSPGSSMRISAPSVVLPAISNIRGNVSLENPAGVILDLNGNTLVLNNTVLSGAGEVIGNVDNVSGVVLPGGPGNLDNLRITGNYSQGSNSALVLEVFNNGFNTVAEQFEVTGQANLDGTLVIGFTTNSLGIVTADFNPFVLNSVNGSFNRVIDAGGNILFINFTGNGFTIVGVSPKIPDAVIGELISFIRDSEGLSEKAASNKSEADMVMQELLKEEGEEGSLSCEI